MVGGYSFQEYGRAVAGELQRSGTITTLATSCRLGCTLSIQEPSVHEWNEYRDAMAKLTAMEAATCGDPQREGWKQVARKQRAARNIQMGDEELLDDAMRDAAVRDGMS